MTLVTNLDLMKLEPKLFVDAADSGLTLASGNDASVSNTSLTSISSDFVTLEISAQDIVVVSNDPIEIVSIDSATSLSTSRRRMSKESPVLKPSAGTGLAFSIISFELVLEHVEALTLAAFGILPNDPDLPVKITDVLNQDDLKRLITLRVIRQGFDRAAAADPANTSLEAMAGFYTELAREAEALTSLLIDPNQDGIAESRRRINNPSLIRN